MHSFRKLFIVIVMAGMVSFMSGCCAKNCTPPSDTSSACKEGNINCLTSRLNRDIVSLSGSSTYLCLYPHRTAPELDFLERMADKHYSPYHLSPEDKKIYEDIEQGNMLALKKLKALYELNCSGSRENLKTALLDTYTPLLKESSTTQEFLKACKFAGYYENTRLDTAVHDINKQLAIISKSPPKFVIEGNALADKEISMTFRFLDGMFYLEVLYELALISHRIDGDKVVLYKKPETEKPE